MPSKNLMKSSNLILRCYREKESDGSWFAICLDLNLAAQADTAKEVKDKLHAQIVNYVKEALTADQEYIEDLIPRRAPLYFFARYYWAKALHLIKGKNGNGTQERIFNDHLPVVPA